MSFSEQFFFAPWYNGNLQKCKNIPVRTIHRYSTTNEIFIFRLAVALISSYFVTFENSAHQNSREGKVSHVLN
jgi:hypothetical protein